MDTNIKISKVLKAGVYLSSLFIIIGILLSIIKGTNSVLETYTLTEMLRGLVSFDYYSYLMCGIFILILTPVLRIVGLLIIYIEEKDYNFVKISLIVLIILAISLVLGVTHS